MLVSAVQQHESTISIHISPSSWAPPSTPLPSYPSRSSQHTQPSSLCGSKYSPWTMKIIWRWTLLRHPGTPCKFGFLFTCDLRLRSQRIKLGVTYSPKPNRHHQPQQKNSRTVSKQGEGTSLVVQWLRLWDFMAGAWYGFNPWSGN